MKSHRGAASVDDGDGDHDEGENPANNDHSEKSHDHGECSLQVATLFERQLTISLGIGKQIISLSEGKKKMHITKGFL